MVRAKGPDYTRGSPGRQGTVAKASFRYKTMLGDRRHARGISAQRSGSQRTGVALGCKAINALLDCASPKSTPWRAEVINGGGRENSAGIALQRHTGPLGGILRPSTY
ncbi:MAG: hypothetical protein ACI9K5_003352 [Gammaproteobacteria bacterium]|jgi:hypothetical protein